MPCLIDIEKALLPNCPIMDSDASLLAGLEQMRAAQSDCVLVMGDKQSTGIVTEHDAIDLLIAGKAVRELTLSEVMTTAPVLLRRSQANDPAAIIRYFQQHPIHALPVVGDDDQIMGVVTEHSLLAALAPDIRAASTLSDNQELLATLFEESTDALFLLDPETLLTVDCNQRAVELFEASDKKDLIGIAGHTLQHQTCSQEGLNAFAAALRTNGIWNTEAEYTTRRGKVFLAHIAAKSIRHGDSTIYVVRLADLSVRKAAEQALQQSQERLDLILKFGRIGTWDWHVAADRLIWNETHFHLLGYAPGEVIPTYQLWRNRVHPDDVERTEAMLNQALATQTPFTVEYRILPTNNKPLRWVYSEGHGIFDEAGQVTRVIGLIVDITERRQAETASRRSQERLQSITDSLPVCISLVDTDYRYRFVNHTYEEWFSRPITEIQSKTVRELHGEDFFQAVKGYLDRGLAGESVSYEVARPSTDQPSRYLSTTVIPAWEGHTRPIGVYVLTVDQTERKRAELALQESEAGLRQAQQIAHLGNWELDATTQRITWSDELFRMFGFDPTGPEPAYAELLNYIHPDDQAQLQHCIDEAIAQGNPYQIDLRILRTDGSFGFMEVRGQAAYDQHGAITRLVGTALDITERKRAEKDLRRIRQFLDSIIENLPAMVFVKEAQTLRFIRFNKAGEVLLGISREELLGKNDYDFFPKHEADFFIARDQEVLTSGQMLDIPEEPIQTRNQGTRLLHTKKIPLLDEAGNPQYLLGISEDITEHKQTEMALQQASAGMQAIFDAFPDIFFRMDNQGAILDYRTGLNHADELYVPPDMFMGKQMHELLPEPTAQNIHSAIQQALQTREIISLEYSLPMLHGEQYYEARLVPLDDQVIATVRNISGRKQTEAELYHAKEAAEAASRAKKRISGDDEPRNPHPDECGYRHDQPLV
ncbi:MAG: PAS domain-containing protein [Candidatus Competibacteraceae bacterium]|nr:PAS domain-containing protein [Candidatus Competibacteraceae bacterium]